MSLTPSTMLDLGTPAPDFQLMDVQSGKVKALNDFKNEKALLVMFLSRHCPYVQHVQQEIAQVGKDYQDRDIAIVAIASNDAESYPDDSFDSLKEQAEEQGFVFPYLFDETQAAAKAFKAACTPDFFLFDENRMLVYRGQLDDSRPGNGKPLTGKDLRTAIDAVLADEKVTADQQPSSGCNIKWKSGNEPDYFSG